MEGHGKKNKENDGRVKGLGWPSLYNGFITGIGHFLIKWSGVQQKLKIINNMFCYIKNYKVKYYEFGKKNLWNIFRLKKLDVN